jgi:hypothetical protein
MTNMTKTIIVFVTAAVVLSCGPTRAWTNPDVRPGDEWIKMTAPEREHWIVQFVSGYVFAAHQICDFVEYDFQPDNPQLRAKAKQTGESPAQICLDKTYHFSRLNLTDKGSRYQLYSAAITSFYVRSAQYRSIPPVILLIDMADGGAKTTDELLRDVHRGSVKVQ